MSIQDVKSLELRKVGRVPIFSTFSECLIIYSSRVSPLGSLVFGVGPHMLLWALASALIIRPKELDFAYSIILVSHEGVASCLWCKYILHINIF